MIKIKERFLLLDFLCCIFYVNHKYTPILTIYPRGVYDLCGGCDMDNCCCNKKTKRSSDEKKLITNRLNRISGQINGINKMI